MMRHGCEHEVSIRCMVSGIHRGSGIQSSSKINVRSAGSTSADGRHEDGRHEERVSARNRSLQEPISARNRRGCHQLRICRGILSGDPGGEILPGAVPHAYGRHGGCYTFVRSSALWDPLSSVYALRGRIANRTRTEPFNFLKFSTSRSPTGPSGSRSTGMRHVQDPGVDLGHAQGAYPWAESRCAIISGGSPWSARARMAAARFPR